MELRDIEIFYQVARSENMTRAAQELGFVQSNITARIRKLERELGCILFERTKRGVFLTEDGKRWLPHVESLLTQWKLTETVLHTASAPTGLLRIGSLETTAAIHAAKWLATYHRRFEHVDLTLHTGTTDELVERVLHRTLDAAFIAGDVVHPDIASLEVAVEELRVVTAADDNWPETLTRPEVVTVTFRSGCTYRRKLEEWLKNQQVGHIRTMECGSIEAIFQLVSGGLGITLMPAAVVDLLSNRIPLRCHSLDADGRIATHLIWSKHRAQFQALTALVEMFREHQDANMNDSYQSQYSGLHLASPRSST
ncbi:MAG: LysR family transcriptional regulator [Actinobacteria bacterium]|nr:LysR family transcriptional regulator [Actinomycetota bacterium]